jgi:hypothetical protein
MKINKNTGLLLLVVSSVATLFLGTTGFYNYEPAQGGATALYRAIQLFSPFLYSSAFLFQINPNK